MTTNGMSLSKRDKFSGNAAFLVPVFPADFPVVGQASRTREPVPAVDTGYPEYRGSLSYNKMGNHPALAGIEFQKKLEAAASDPRARAASPRPRRWIPSAVT